MIRQGVRICRYAVRIIPKCCPEVTEIYNMWENKKRLKGRNKRAKLERMMRRATAIDILSNEKYHKATKEALKEIDKEKNLSSPV